jgi:hypothetical protein
LNYDIFPAKLQRIDNADYADHLRKVLEAINARKIQPQV